MAASNQTAGEHTGFYLECQTGRVPTQMHDFLVPAKSSSGWTEWFKAAAFKSTVVRADPRLIVGISAVLS